MTESSSDMEKGKTESTALVLPDNGKCKITEQNISDELPSANKMLNEKLNVTSNRSAQNVTTVDVSDDATSENASNKPDDANQASNLSVEKCNKKPAKEVGELLSSDDCSTSNTTDELLEELGINEHVTQSPVPVPVNNVPSEDLSIKSVGTPVSTLTGDAASQGKVNPIDLKTNGNTRQEIENASSHVDDYVPTSQNEENINLVSGPKLPVKNEPEDDVPNITDYSKLEAKELEDNTQFTFHMLQEQIEQLQCKIETKEVTCGEVKNLIKTEQVKFSSDRRNDDPISVSSGVDSDTESAGIKIEPINETKQDNENQHDSNTSKLNVNSLRKHKHSH